MFFDVLLVFSSRKRRIPFMSSSFNCFHTACGHRRGESQEDSRPHDRVICEFSAASASGDEMLENTFSERDCGRPTERGWSGECGKPGETPTNLFLEHAISALADQKREHQLSIGTRNH